MEEIKNFRRLMREDKELVFYAENENYYPYLEGLLAELGKPVHYITSDHSGDYYINKLFPALMPFIKCKVFVMTMTDLNQFYIKRSIYPVHYVYVFHSLVSTHMIYRAGAFDYYDSILCVGPHQIDEIRQYESIYGLKPKELVEAGYYRLEELYKEYKDHEREGKGVNVLVAPTWGSTNLMEVCGRKILDMLVQEGYCVTLRLHPETVKREGFTEYRGVKLETSVASMDSLIEADILITEWSGIGLEYAFGTERPVIFIDTPPKVRNPKYKELGIEPIESKLRSEIGVVVSPDELEKLPKIIEGMIGRREEYRSRLSELRWKYVYNFGSSSKVGADYIRSLCGGLKHSEVCLPRWGMACL